MGRQGQLIGYRAWYSVVFKGLVQCLKIALEVERVKNYVAQSGRLFRCSAGSCNRGRNFKTYAKWKVHALREHPEVFTITGTANEASSLEAATAKKAFDVARIHIEEAITARTLAAEHTSDTVQVPEAQQSTGQIVIHLGSMIANAIVHLLVGVFNLEPDAHRKSTVERNEDAVHQKISFDNATQQAIEDQGRTDAERQISERPSSTPAGVTKASDRGDETATTSPAKIVVSGQQRMDITSLQSALNTTVSEHQIALERIADLELKYARSKEDVDCGVLREVALKEEIEYKAKSISEWEEGFKTQQSELEEAIKRGREMYKEGREDGENAIRKKMNCVE